MIAARFRSHFASAGRICPGHLAHRNRFDSRGGNVHRMLYELPDGNEQAQEDRGVSNGFESSSASFFRANQESVCRFLVIVHKSVWLTCAPLCNDRATQICVAITG